GRRRRLDRRGISPGEGRRPQEGQGRQRPGLPCRDAGPARREWPGQGAVGRRRRGAAQGQGAVRHGRRATVCDSEGEIDDRRAGVIVPMTDVTEMLAAIDRGEARADGLLPLVYEELRRLAKQKLAQEKPGQTLDATGLVHEAYLRLVD